MDIKGGFDLTKTGAQSLPARADFETSPDPDKEDRKAEHAGILKRLGNLNDAEIAELIGYEFVAGPQTVKEQVSRYYLQIKSEKPHRAEDLKTAIGSIDESDSHLQRADIVKLCNVLDKFISGFVVHHNGRTYTADHLYSESAVEPREHLGKRLFWKSGSQVLSGVVTSEDSENPRRLVIERGSIQIRRHGVLSTDEHTNRITDGYDFYLEEASITKEGER